MKGKRPQPETIWVESGFGYHSREPFVSVKLRDVAVMVSPAEARDLAANLITCAEAAEGDGFIVTFFTEKMGLTAEQVGPLLRDFRDYRARQQENGAGNEDA